MPDSALFRKQALDAKAQRFIGEVFLYRPVSFFWLTVSFVVIAVALSLFLAWGEYTRKERSVGYLAPDRGAIKVYATLAGTVTERRVREGASVNAGDVLLIVSAERQSADAGFMFGESAAQLKNQQSALSQERIKQTQLTSATVRGLAARMERLKIEKIAALGEIATQRERVAMSNKSVVRFQDLANSKFISNAQVQQKQEEQLDQQARLQALEHTLLSLERDIASIKDQIPQEQLRGESQLTTIDRNVALLSQQAVDLEGKRSVAITAPVAGIVTTMLADVGQVATGNVPLLTILPIDAKLEAELLVPTRAIGFLTAGQEVNVRYAAFPYERFGHQIGKILLISKSTVNPQEVPNAIDSREPMYRVTVALNKQSVAAYGKEYPLAAGMLLDADILIDKRKLYEWVLDPLYSVTGQL